MHRYRDKAHKASIIMSFAVAVVYCCPSNAEVVLNVDQNGPKYNDHQKQSICQFPRKEIFSCRLESGSDIGICLNPLTKSLYLYTNVNSPKFIFQKIDQPRQTIGANAHGYSTIVSGFAFGKQQTIFVDTDFNDPSMAAISDQNDTRFCARDKFNTNSYYDNLTSNRVDIFSLLNLGVTTQLTPVPDWPYR